MSCIHLTVPIQELNQFFWRRELNQCCKFSFLQLPPLSTHRNSTSSCRFALHIIKIRYLFCIASSPALPCRHHYQRKLLLPRWGARGLFFTSQCAAALSNKPSKHHAMVHSRTCIQFIDRFTAVVLLGNSLGSCLFRPAIDTEKHNNRKWSYTNLVSL